VAWLERHEPAAARAAAWFLLPGSWVAWRASGVLAVDPANASSTALLDPRARAWVAEACAAFDVDPARLAPVEPAETPLGTIAPWLREATGLPAWTLVVLGTGDEMAATLGAGVVEPGVVCDVMGTAEPVCAVVAEPAHDPTGLVELHPHAEPSTWLLENPGWLSGGAYRWFRDELGGPEAARAAQSGADVYELLNALAEHAPPGADGVCWVPALAGAMAPEWNARARAGWYGVTAAHTRAHLARALLEGNALALRDVIEAIAAAGHSPREVVCVGGGAKGRLLCELRANVTGLPVSRPDDVETTARGAAMLAAVGAGLHASVAAAAHAMAGPRSAPAEPDPELRPVYDELHRRHLRLYEALRPLFDSPWAAEVSA
jgi:xylulokinase